MVSVRNYISHLLQQVEGIQSSKITLTSFSHPEADPAAPVSA